MHSHIGNYLLRFPPDYFIIVAVVMIVSFWYNDSKREAAYKYKAAHIKRIPLDVQVEFYEEIKAAAEKTGETVNGFIKKAIEARLEEIEFSD